MSAVQPARIMVESNNSNRSYPVLVVVRQQKGVLSWQLPLVVESGTDLYVLFLEKKTGHLQLVFCKLKANVIINCN